MCRNASMRRCGCERSATLETFAMSARPALSLRRADHADLPGLIACDVYAQAQEARRQELQHWVEQQSCFIALAGNESAGFVVLQQRAFFGHGFIPLVCVAEGHQRQGIGRFLLAQAERLCIGPKLFTSTNTSNIRAQGLFSRAGFVTSGRIENLDEADPELVYFKAIDPAG